LKFKIDSVSEEGNSIKKKVIEKILGGLIVAVLVVLITQIVASAWNNYALVGYQLSAPMYAYSREALQIDLNLDNKGNIGAVPVSTVYVVNATIQMVSIPNVAAYQLSEFCSFNSTTATITNLTIEAGRQLSIWASIYAIPNEGAATFGVYSSVALPHDVFHPKSRPIRILPYELVYNATSPGVYKKLD